jgi:hypothetical protein
VAVVCIEVNGITDVVSVLVDGVVGAIQSPLYSTKSPHVVVAVVDVDVVVVDGVGCMVTSSSTCVLLSTRK